MSHIVGTLQTVAPPIKIGPDSGPATNPPNTWTLKFQHTPAPTGTKLLILHFANASLPASNRLEVDLGYGGADTMDVFTSADGADFWTRPVNVAAFADGKVPIRYIRNGGGATVELRTLIRSQAPGANRGRTTGYRQAQGRSSRF
jgi:hypothetical protein